MCVERLLYEIVQRKAIFLIIPVCFFEESLYPSHCAKQNKNKNITSVPISNRSNGNSQKVEIEPHKYSNYLWPRSKDSKMKKKTVLSTMMKRELYIHVQKKKNLDRDPLQKLTQKE